MNQMNKTIENEETFQRLGISTKTKSFQRYYHAGLLNNVDEDFIGDVQDYWMRHYGKKVNPSLHLAFMNLTGKKEPRIIPWSHRNEIIYFFNDINVQPGYNDKNIFDKLINAPNSVEIVLKRVRGNYFDANNRQIARDQVMNSLLNSDSDLIIKPSKTDDGIGIEKLQRKEDYMCLGDSRVDLLNLEDMYGYNYIVQKIIKQHPVMAVPHPHSVNTLRMVTFRWNNEIRNLLTFARFGADGAITDNAGTGGLCCGVNESGEFMNIAINKKAISFTHHPTSGYPFASAAQVPNYDEVKEFVINLHKDILHHDFISWDIAIGLDGKPIFLEANFRGGATWIYQLATQKPIYGDLTEEVLQHVSSQLKRSKFIRDTKPAILRQTNQKAQNKFIIQGLFQESGYCKWISESAVELNLNGYCRELEDGNIEVVVAGDDDNAISEFKRRLEKGSDKAHVEGITVQSWHKPVPSGFEIKLNGYKTINKLIDKIKMQKQALKEKKEEVQRAKSRVLSLNETIQEKEEKLKQTKEKHKQRREDMKQKIQALHANLQEKEKELKKANKNYKDIKFSRDKAKRRSQMLSLKLQDKKMELKLTRRKYKKIKQSRLWRYTAPLRKVGNFFRRG